MAYARSAVFRGPVVDWQQVTLAAPRPAWSEGYRVAGPRLLLPIARCFECRLGGEAFVCDPGAALWLDPADEYRLRQPWDGQRSALLALDADATGLFGRSRRVRLPLTTHLRLAHWARAWAGGEIEPLTLEEDLLDLLRELMPDKDRSPAPHRAVERARAFIAAEPQRTASLAEIARAAHCSPFHLARHFRRQTGQSLHGFRTSLRMAMAIDRLRQGERDLGALAVELGYASQSHFGDAFRRCLGTPPGQVRTNLIAPRRP